MFNYNEMEDNKIQKSETILKTQWARPQISELRDQETAAGIYKGKEGYHNFPSEFLKS